VAKKRKAGAPARSERLNRRYQRLRKRYSEVHGKVVDFISHDVEDGTLYFTVRFQDQTSLSIRYECTMSAIGAELSDVMTGDIRVLREYKRSKIKLRRA
jgi:hypothetical protein